MASFSKLATAVVTVFLLIFTTFGQSQTTKKKIAIVPKNLASIFFYNFTFNGCLDALNSGEFANQLAENGFDDCWFNGTEQADVPGTLEVLRKLMADPLVT